MSQLLIKSPSSAQIVGEVDTQFILDLDKHLSFFINGSEYTAAFKGFFNKAGDFVKWDGMKHLLTPSLTFPIGLIPRVKSFYQAANKEVEVIDKRPAKSVGNPIDIMPRLNEINKPPYQYQIDALNATDTNSSGIIKVATGGGKSLIAALIIAKLGKKSILFVIGTALLHQFHSFFTDVFQRPIGIIGDGLCDIQDITIASIWTVGQAFGLKKGDIILDNDEKEKQVSKAKYDDIKKLVKEAKVSIIDECHMAACDTIQTIFQQSKSNEHFYGLSGSPWRDDNQDLLIEGILGSYIVDIPASLLIEKGFLAKPIIHFRVVPPLDYEIEKNYKTIYQHYVVNNPTRNKMILESAKLLVSKGYQTLVLFSSIKHGKELYRLFKDELPCALLDGSNSNEEREQVKEDLASKKINCIIASRIMDIGVDIPTLSGLVVGSGGKSTVRALQRVGRVIRKLPGSDKTSAAIIDFIDAADYLYNHSKTRNKIYKTEKGFEVIWPKKKK
jgi:superfamily II DNA or RNA helicase